MDTNYPPIASTPKGAVVVVQEVFGINPHIRKMADQFAAEGYVHHRAGAV
jgi:dienelactone hydrolase